MLFETINENKEKLSKINKKLDNELKQKNIIMMRQTVKDSVDNLDLQWDYMTQKEKQTIVRTLVNKVIITGRTVKVELKIFLEIFSMVLYIQRVFYEKLNKF